MGIARLNCAIRCAVDSAINCPINCSVHRPIYCPIHCAIYGLLQGDRQMLDEWFKQHCCRIDRQNDHFLSTLRQTIPFQVWLVEYSILRRRPKVRDDAWVWSWDISPTRLIVRLPNPSEDQRGRGDAIGILAEPG